MTPDVTTRLKGSALLKSTRRSDERRFWSGCDICRVPAAGSIRPACAINRFVLFRAQCNSWCGRYCRSTWLRGRAASLFSLWPRCDDACLLLSCCLCAKNGASHSCCWLVWATAILNLCQPHGHQCWSRAACSEQLFVYIILVGGYFIFQLNGRVFIDMGKHSFDYIDPRSDGSQLVYLLK